MELVQLVRVVQMLILAILIGVLCTGPGFYLRQEWRGFTSKTVDGSLEYDRVIQCGYEAKYEVGRTWRDGIDSCGLPGHPDLPVPTLRGYNGYCSVLMWAPLSMYGQFASLVLALGLAICCIGLMVTLTPAMSKPPKTVVLIIIALSAVLMIVIMALQWYYINCGNYAESTLQDFDVKIKKMINDGTYPSLTVAKDNRVVQCRVKGFGITAFFAMLSIFVYIVEGVIYWKMKPVSLNANKHDADVPDATVDTKLT